VLIIDGDPQCTLTAFYAGSPESYLAQEALEKEQKKYEDAKQNEGVENLLVLRGSSREAERSTDHSRVMCTSRVYKI